MSEDHTSLALVPSEKSAVNDWSFGKVEDLRGNCMRLSRVRDVQESGVEATPQSPMQDQGTSQSDLSVPKMHARPEVR